MGLLSDLNALWFAGTEQLTVSLLAAAMQISFVVVHCKAELLEPGKFGFCHDGSERAESSWPFLKATISESGRNQ